MSDGEVLREIQADMRVIRESQIRAEPATKLAAAHELLLKGRTGVNGLVGDVAALKSTEERRQAGYRRMWGVLVAFGVAGASSLGHLLSREK